MDQVLSVIRALGLVIAGASAVYGATYLSYLGFCHITKKQQKLEEARDGMKNTFIGVGIALGSGIIMTWFTSQLGF